MVVCLRSARILKEIQRLNRIKEGIEKSLERQKAMQTGKTLKQYKVVTRG